MGERFAAEVRRALTASGRTQTWLAQRIPLARSKVNEICNGHYLPSVDTARKMIEVLGMDEDRTLRLLGEARAARVGTPEPSWDRPLRPELTSLLRAQASAADVLPYKLPGSRPVSLSTLYVRQELGSGIEETPARAPEIPQPADRDPGWRSRNPERFRSLLSVRPPSRPIREALDEHDHLVVTGGPGQGKSTLALRLSAELAAAWNGEPPPITEPVIPLRLPARELAARLTLPFAEALAQSVLAEYGQMLHASVPPELFAARVEGARWLLLIDAVDEVADASARDTLINSLARWATENVHRIVVTSRPLEGAGLAPLHQAAAARFELLPFDADALRVFAEHWFASAEASGQFLEQVRHGQLDDLIQVPLLAAIAAIVFEQYGDRSLPDNKYSLYEDYLAYLGSTRVHPDMRDLLEHLGFTRVETDGPLLRAAHAWTIRSTDLVPNLLATGVLVMRAGKLQFLHHSFAEHLAATAKARRLPVPFDPEDPLWRSAIHEARNGWSTDHAREVLVHYLHLHRGQGDALVQWLTDRTVELHQVAADLLAQRAPVSERVLQSFLDTVRAWAMTTTFDATRILRRAARAAPDEWLMALLAESEAPWESRIEVASALGRRPHAPGWSQAIELLRTVTGEGELRLSLRLLAAQSLARAGREHWEIAADGLKAVLADSSTEARDRRAAAVALADLGPQGHAYAVAALQATLSGETAPVGDLVHAAAGLAEIGIEFHDQVLAIFDSITHDDTVGPEHRRDAALALGALGPAYVAAAAASLADMITSPREIAATERSAAAVDLAKLGPEYVAMAARHLADLAEDPWSTDAHHRYVNATNLGKLGSAYHGEAARLLRDILVDPIAIPNERVWAAMGLATLGPDYEAEAAQELERLTADPVAKEFDRWWPTRILADLGHEFRDRAVAILLDALADRALGSADRHWITLALSYIGPEFRQQAAESLRHVVFESTATRTRIRAYAAEWLARICPSQLHEVVTELRDMVWSPSTSKFGRPEAAQELCECAPELAAEAAAALVAFTGDVRSYIGMFSITVLVGLGRDHEADAAALCAAFLEDRTNGPFYLTEAAGTLASLGGEFRSQAVRILRGIVAYPYGADRRHATAAAILGYFGTEFRAEARIALQAIMRDPATTVGGRTDAARSLARYGEDEQEAVGTLEVLVAEAVGDPQWTRAVEALSRVNGRGHSLAVGGVRAIVTAYQHRPKVLLDAAFCLARLGREFRAEAVELLRGQVTDPTLSTTDRTSALRQLVRLDPSVRDLAIAYLTEVVCDERAQVIDRCAAADCLVRLDRDRWTETGRVLAGIRASQLRTVDERQQVVVTLHRINAITNTEAVQALLEAFQDPTSPADVRAETPDYFVFDEYVPPATAAQLKHDLLADAMALPSLRGEDESMLQDVITAPEFDQATKRDALLHLATHHPGRLEEVADLLTAGRHWVALGSLSGRHRLRAIDLCVAVVDDHAEPLTQRWRAAVALDDLKADDPAALPLFRDMLGARSHRAVRAAEALVRLGHDIGLEALRRVSADRLHNDHTRMTAAKALIEWSRVDRPQAVAVLDELAADSWRAAKALATVAPEYRDKAVAYLRQTLRTGTCQARIEAAAAVVEVDRTAFEHAAKALREVARHPRHATRALFALGRLARPYCDEALPGLRDLTKQGDHTQRRRAAAAIASLRRDLREEAALVAVGIARDGSVPWHIRAKAAADLARWSVLCRVEARGILLEVGLRCRPT